MDGLSMIQACRARAVALCCTPRRSISPFLDVLKQASDAELIHQLVSKPIQGEDSEHAIIRYRNLKRKENPETGIEDQAEDSNCGR